MTHLALQRQARSASSRASAPGAPRSAVQLKSAWGGAAGGALSAASVGQALQRLEASPEGGAKDPTQTPSDAHAIAGQGVAGAQGSLPHRDAIQQAFGGHDVSGIGAKVGGEAGDAARALDAEAYAYGEQVAFAKEPDLFTAAHEAAHVVQQRGGAQVPGGVGRPGDAFEQHADAVAQRVVQGQSAEELLGGEGGGGSPAVQCKAPKKTPYEVLEETLDTLPVDVAALRKALGKLKSADRTHLFGDKPRLNLTLQLLSAAGDDAVKLCEGLDLDLPQTVEALRDAGLAAQLTSATFTKTFEGASAAALIALANSPVLGDLRAAAPALTPLSAKAIKDKGKGFAQAVADPLTWAWMRDVAGGPAALVASLSKKVTKHLKEDLTTLGVMFADPAFLPPDIVAALKTLGFTPEAPVETLAAQSPAVLAAPAFVAWFNTITVKQLKKLLKAGHEVHLSAHGAGALLPLTIPIVAASPQTFGELVGGYAGFRLWVVAVGSWADLCDHITHNADATMLKALAGGAQWQPLLDDLKAQRMGGVAQTRDALDKLFELATTLTVMQPIFAARFGIAVGSQDATAKAWLEGDGRKERSFDAEGLREVYNGFKVLPPTHIEDNPNLTQIMRYGDKHDNVGGAASDQYFRLKYDQSNPGELESGQYTEPGDGSQGLNLIGATSVHEFAHRLDNGGAWSGLADFRAISGWKEYSTNARYRVLADDLAANLTPAYDTGLTGDEKTLAKDGAVHAITNRRDDMADVEQDLEQAYDDAGKNKTPPAGTDPRAAADLFAVLKTTAFYQHIIDGHRDNELWWQEPQANTSDARSYHEAYKDEWYSYDNAARTPKLSQYQFRDPGEEFAEVYATYHVSTPKGTGVPAAFKTWFEGKNLHTG